MTKSSCADDEVTRTRELRSTPPIATTAVGNAPLPSRLAVRASSNSDEQCHQWWIEIGDVSRSRSSTRPRFRTGRGDTFTLTALRPPAMP